MTTSTNNKKILVTGAKGFVGKNLVEALKNIKDGKDRTHPKNENYKYLMEQIAQAGCVIE